MSYDPLGERPKIEMAREAVRLAARALDEGDQIGVLAFDDRQDWLVPIQVVVGEIDRRRIDAAIAGLTTDGGTELLPALTVGLDALRAVEAEVRHVVVLSDGKSRTGTREDYRRLVAGAAEAGITVSTIAIGGDADAELLAFLAELGGGRYHVAATAEEIPTLTVEEAELVVDPGTPSAATPAAFAPTHRIGSSGSVNLRPEPSKSNTPIRALPPETPLQYLNEDAPTEDPTADGRRWMRFRTAGGDEGWVREVDVEPYRP